jgi:ABC-type histidine transport system ATPase subunit
LKYGLPTVLAVGIASAIGVIISMLKSAGSGLKTMGVALKNLGKKMAPAVPGLLGSVISLILKTGGELLKFVGNNIWILVVALGMVFMKEIKKR